MNDRQCQGRAMSYLGGHCARPASVTRDGKRYCYQHDPVRLSESRQAKAQRLREESEQRHVALEAQWARNDLEKAAGVRDLTDDELRQIIAQGGIKKLLNIFAPTGT